MAAFGAISSGSIENDTNLVLSEPSGTEAGDLLIFIGYAGVQGAAGTFSATGYTQVLTGGAGSGNNGCQMTVLAKIATGSDSFTFAITDNSTEQSGVVYRITGTFSSVSNIIASRQAAGVEQVDDDPSYDITDITPQANSFLIMAVACEVGNNATSTVSSYAINADDPTWTERADFGFNATVDQRFGTATATRAEATTIASMSADFNSSNNADPDRHQGVLLFIKDTANVTVNPTVISTVASVQAPTITGGAVVSPSVIESTASVQAPTITTEASKITNMDKSTASTITNQDKS